MIEINVESGNLRLSFLVRLGEWVKGLIISRLISVVGPCPVIATVLLT